MSSFTKSPCTNCAEGFIGCHSSCKVYFDWKQEREVILNNMRKQRAINHLAYNNESYRNKKILPNNVMYGRNGID